MVSILTKEYKKLQVFSTFINIAKLSVTHINQYLAACRLHCVDNLLYVCVLQLADLTMLIYDIASVASGLEL